MTRALLIETVSSEHCLEAARRLAQRGITVQDAFVPYPDETLLEGLNVSAPKLSKPTLAAALFGAALAYGVLYFTQVFDYPLDVSGHATHAVLAFVPITFETAVLFGSCAAFFGFLFVCGLPRLHHALFEHARFRRATIDRWFLLVHAEEERVRDIVGDQAAEIIALESKGK